MRFKFNRQQEDALVAKLLDSETSQRHVAEIYSQFVRSTTHNPDYRFLPFNKDSDNYKKKLSLIQKLIALCIENKAIPEVFIAAQFSIIGPYLATQGVSHVPLPVMLTKKAVERYFEYISKTEANYITTTEKTDALFKTRLPDYEKILRDTLTLFTYRMQETKKRGFEITDALILSELEMLLRANAISSLILAVSPKMTDEKLSCSPYLVAAKNKVIESIDPRWLEGIQKSYSDLKSLGTFSELL